MIYQKKVLKEVQNSIKEIHKDIHKIIEDNKIGEKIRDGFRVSITGEVNAGKSSLLNLIAKRDVAIVSERSRNYKRCNRIIFKY